MAEYLPVLELSSLDGTNGFQIIGKGATDGFGRSVSSAGDINGDGFADLIVGAPHADSYASAFVVFGMASGFGATLEASALDGNNGFQLIGPPTHDETGASVSSAGDVNGDGLSDFIIGAYNANASQSGASYVVFGKATGFDRFLHLESLDGTNGLKITGEDSSDSSGRSVSAAGDVNGDGFADVIVGAPRAFPTSGASYVVFGRASSSRETLELSSLHGNNGFQINGQAGDYSGVSVSSAGDVNGDSLGDLIIGAYKAHPNGSFSGASYVVFGKPTRFAATLELSSLDGTNGFKISGEAASDRSGAAVSSAGDVNGDGFADLIVGAYHADPNGESSGASYVVLSKGSGFAATVELSSLDGNNGFQINGEAADDDSGRSVSDAGDVNGDGFADLIVGAWHADANGDYSGASYVVFGMASGFGATLELSSLDGNNGFRIDGESEHDRSGTSVSSAGDVNGDGFDDLIVGATGFNQAGRVVGAAYVIFGSMPSEAVTRTGTDIANTIHGGNFDDALRGRAGDDTLLGHGGKDRMAGGAGDDTLIGSASKDTLAGSQGSDTFVFQVASDSTGKVHDTITAIDFTSDLIDTTATIGGIDAAIGSGQLDGPTFNADLEAAVDAAHLGADHAVLFTPDSGNKASKTFLIVDQNGTAGYQTEADLVIELTATSNLASIDVADFI